MEIFERVCVGQFIPDFKSTKKFRCFKPQTFLTYDAFCDDFGPLNLTSIVTFIERLDHQLRSFTSSRIVYMVDNGRRELTNALFLLGAYMILRREMRTEEVKAKFSWLPETSIEYYRDATFSKPDFGLTLENCWRGLEKGKSSGWLNYPAIAETEHWGMIDVDQYAHWDSPLNGGFQVVVPGKFVAFRGPTDLNGAAYSDAAGYRQFSPAHYISIFQELGVKTVVRLNEPEYDGGDFAAQGIRHHDLYFDDCTAPPARVVRRFLDIVDAAEGLVAVHCKAGLGRTGTLIALYLMRRRGFTARAAMGWLRITQAGMLPGSVIGEQHLFLCHELSSY
jgi:cell division cycle 14